MRAVLKDNQIQFISKYPEFNLGADGGPQEAESTFVTRGSEDPNVQCDNCGKSIARNKL